MCWGISGQNQTRVSRTLGSSTHELRLQGLAALTTYAIEVAALTAKGPGLPVSSFISSGAPPGQQGPYKRDPSSDRSKEWGQGSEVLALPLPCRKPLGKTPLDPHFPQQPLGWGIFWGPMLGSRQNCPQHFPRFSLRKAGTQN